MLPDMPIQNNVWIFSYFLQFVWTRFLEFAMFPASWRLQCCSLVLIFVVLSVVVSRASAKDAWERPGCHKVGTKPVSICEHL